MPHNRFYYPEKLLPKQKITLKGNEHRHLFKVMRLNENETVEIIDGKGTLAIGKIIHSNREFSQIFIEKCSFEKKINKIILVQSMLRSQKMDLIIEKATELGVSDFIFLPAEFSEKREYSQNQLDRMRQITISATKQCGRLYIPSIEILSSMKEIFHKEKSIYLFGDLSADAKPFREIKKTLSNKELSIFFIIGPEKGFSRKEEKTLIQNDAIGVKSSYNILRAETAAVHFASLITYETDI